MKNLQDFITERFDELDRGIVATPEDRFVLENFARCNQGSMDLVLMQMAIQFGYKMAMEDVQEILDTDNEDQFEKEAREIENIEKDN